MPCRSPGGARPARCRTPPRGGVGDNDACDKASEWQRLLFPADTTPVVLVARPTRPRPCLIA
eukprot:2294115-Pyramimonas_sp.AAC.1